LLLPGAAAIAGRSAAYLHGVRIAAPDDPVEVIVPRRHRFGPVAGLRIRFAAIGPQTSRASSHVSPRRCVPRSTSR
jgi:hypothetical protein